MHIGLQRCVTHDSLRYINILTYLLTYLLISIPFLLNWESKTRLRCGLHHHMMGLHYYYYYYYYYYPVLNAPCVGQFKWRNRRHISLLADTVIARRQRGKATLWRLIKRRDDNLCSVPHPSDKPRRARTRVGRTINFHSSNRVVNRVVLPVMFSSDVLDLGFDQPIQSVTVSLAAIIHTEVSVSSAAQLGHCCSSFLCCCSETLVLSSTELSNCSIR